MQLSICYDVLKKRPHEEDQKRKQKAGTGRKSTMTELLKTVPWLELQLTERCQTNFIKIEKLQ